MSNFFITISSFKKIIQLFEADLSNFIDSQIEEVVNQNFEINCNSLFNAYEIKRLFATVKFIEILKSRSIFNAKQPDKRIQKHLAFDTQKPRYHSNISCKNLNMSYLNFEIPVEIMGIKDDDRKEKEIERFKDFCRKNTQLARDDENKFINQLTAQFFLKNPPNKITYDNTGHAKFNLTAKELKNHIDKAFEDYLNLLDGYQDIKYIPANKAKKILTHLPQYKDIPPQVLEYLQSGKEGLISQLQTYLFQKNDISMNELEENILKTYGFMPCTKCFSNPIKTT